MQHPFITWFRECSPYIHTHRGKTFVIELSDELVLHANFANLIYDIAVLNSLGVRLALVHGAEATLNKSLQTAGLESRYDGGERIIDSATLSHLKAVIGHLRVEFESKLSKSLPNSPMGGAKIRVTSGNFIVAKPLGVRNGVDFGHSGCVRRIDKEAIEERLNAGNIVLFSPIGYSLTGEPFYLNAEEAAVELAIELKADKLIFLIPGKGLAVREMNIGEASKLVKKAPHLPLEQAIKASEKGVPRVHLVDGEQDGALLQELFTRDGLGTMLTRLDVEACRQGRIEDVGGILALIEPLEREEILVRRPREVIEAHIERFVVIERDGVIIGCATLHLFAREKVGELACLAVHPDYRRAGRAEQLLQAIEKQAKKLKLKTLIVLTTRASHWFLERGFYPIELEELPLERQALYNYQRRSKTFAKKL